MKALGCVAVLAVGGLIVLVIANTPGSPSRATSASTPSSSASPRHPFEQAAKNDVDLALQIQRLINNAGERCDAVANTRAGGKVENGDVLFLADCAGGASHTLLLTPDNRLRYWMECDSAVNPVC